MLYGQAIAIRDQFLSGARDLHRGRRVQPMVIGREGASEQLAPSRPFSIALGLAPSDDPEQFAIAVRTTAPAAFLEQSFLPALYDAAKGDVDLLVLDRIQPRQSRQRQTVRPLEIGLSIGHPDITAGTLGAFVRDRATGRLGILSNNHVLANVDQAQPGDPILQPGPHDKPPPPLQQIGQLDRFVPIANGEVDAAFALVDIAPADPGDIGGQIRLSGAIARPSTRLAVAKLGRTTGFTRGQISAIDLLDVEVEFQNGIHSFDGQIEVRSPSNAPFSLGGDSGSLVVADNGDAVGLLFAGGPTADGRFDVTFINPIQAVLDALSVDLVH